MARLAPSAERCRQDSWTRSLASYGEARLAWPLGELALDRQRSEYRLHGMASAVALAAALDPRARLVRVVDGQDAEADRDARGQLHVLQAASAFAADIVVVIGLATDDRAECDDRREATALRGVTADQRELERAGHLEHLDLRDPSLLERIARALLQRVG